MIKRSLAGTADPLLCRRVRTSLARVGYVRVPYDVEKAARAVEESPLPDAFADMLRKAY